MSRHYRFILHNTELVTEQTLTFELPDNPTYDSFEILFNQNPPIPHLNQIISGLIAVVRRQQLSDNGYGYELHYIRPDTNSPYVAWNGKEYLTKQEFEKV